MTEYKELIMSRCLYFINHAGHPHYGAPAPLFTMRRAGAGVLSTWLGGIAFGASQAYALLGPDLKMPGQTQINPPTATHNIWTGLANDAGYVWIRGHLINGRWGGVGNNWLNLTPLTVAANANHAYIESVIDNFLSACLTYEDANYRTHWYGVYYSVQCSLEPLALHPTPLDLYSYAPAFIKVSWRAISIQKPEATAAHQITPGDVNQTLLTGAINTVPHLPFAFQAPAIPQVLPAGNIPGGVVRGGLPPGFPAQQHNGFDNQIEIHQT